MSAGGHTWTGTVAAGDGRVVVDGGNVRLPTGASFDAGATELLGTLPGEGGQGGRLRLEGTGTATTDTLLLDGGERDGDRTLTAGSFDARRGHLRSGRVTATTTFAKTTSGQVQLRGGSIQVDGAGTFSAGTIAISVAGDGIGTVAVGGTLRLLEGVPETPFPNLGNSGRITVRSGGRLVKESPGLAIVDRAVDVDGRLEVATGTLRVTQGDDSPQAGTLAVAAGRRLELTGGGNFVTGTLDVDGALRVAGGRLLVHDGATLDAATLELPAGSRLDVTGPGTATVGTLELDGGQKAGDRSVAVGTLNATGGRLGSVAVSGAFSKTTEARLFLNGGTVRLGGPSTIAAGDVCHGEPGNGTGGLAVAGTLTATTPVAVPIGQCNVAVPLEVLSGGTLRVPGTRTVSPRIDSAGRVEVRSGEALTASGGLVQTAGTTVVDGLLTATTTLQGGVLRGRGQLTGALSNTGGTVAPGASPGVLTVDGSYTQGSGGTLQVEVDGVDAAVPQFDRLLVSGTATLGGTLSVVPGPELDPAGTDRLRFLTSANTVTEPFATPAGGTFPPLPSGKRLRVEHPSTGGRGAELVVDLPPVPAGGTPTVAGTPAVGQTVTCEEGTWTPQPVAFAYAWLRHGAPIAGATGRTYVVTADDATRRLACRVVASNGGGAGPPATSADRLVPAVPPQSTGTPQVTGDPAPGGRLTCTASFTGGPPPAVRFTWTRDGVPIPGATAPTYAVTAADAGSALRCVASAENVAGRATATSDPVAVPAPPVVPTPPPGPVVPGAPAATPQETALAAAAPSTVASALGLPAARRCVSRRAFTIRVQQPRGVRLERVVVGWASGGPRCAAWAGGSSPPSTSGACRRGRCGCGSPPRR